MTDPDADRFASTEEYYAKYRPRYGEDPLRYVRERFDLDESARVLDLGCGAGQIAIPMASHVGSVVGMDPNEEMLRHARRLATEEGVENVEWVVGSDADVEEDLGPVRLTTMGRSFHWMDQDGTLERLYRLTVPGGGVAILNDPEWLTRGTREWQAEVHEIAGAFVDDLPERTGPVNYDDDDPWDELVADHGFADVERVRLEFEREWRLEEVIGYVFSLSFCAPRTFGEDQSAFESAVREQLGGRGPFVQDVTVEVISGRVPAE